MRVRTRAALSWSLVSLGQTLCRRSHTGVKSAADTLDLTGIDAACTSCGASCFIAVQRLSAEDDVADVALAISATNGRFYAYRTLHARCGRSARGSPSSFGPCRDRAAWWRSRSAVLSTQCISQSSDPRPSAFRRLARCLENLRATSRCEPPSVESSGDRPPRPMFSRQIPPRRTGTHQPEDRIEKSPMANRRPSDQGLFRRQQRFYARPLLVREAMSWHSLKKFLRIPPLSFKQL